MAGASFLVAGAPSSHSTCAVKIMVLEVSAGCCAGGASHTAQSAGLAVLARRVELLGQFTRWRNLQMLLQRFDTDSAGCLPTALARQRNLSDRQLETVAWFAASLKMWVHAKMTFASACGRDYRHALPKEGVEGACGTASQWRTVH